MQNNSLLYKGYFLGDRHSFSPINSNFTTNSNSSKFKSFEEIKPKFETGV